MKRNILLLLLTAVFVFAISYSFIGCKKQEADKPADAKTEEAKPAEAEQAK